MCPNGHPFRHIKQNKTYIFILMYPKKTMSAIWGVLVDSLFNSYFRCCKGNATSGSSWWSGRRKYWWREPRKENKIRFLELKLKINLIWLWKCSKGINRSIIELYQNVHVHVHVHTTKLLPHSLILSFTQANLPTLEGPFYRYNECLLRHPWQRHHHLQPLPHGDPVHRGQASRPGRSSFTPR